MQPRDVIEALEAVSSLPEGMRLEGADITGCGFEGIDLTEGSIRGARLTDCRFVRCEMTLLDVADATMHDVEFRECRLQAVDFGALARDPIGISVRFVACDLTLASFRGLDLRMTTFDGGRGHEATFVGVDLRRVSVTGIDLTGAEIRDCDLREADLRGSSGFVLSPCANRVRGMRIDAANALGLLAAVGVRCE